VLGTGSSSSDHDRFCSTATHSSWLMSILFGGLSLLAKTSFSLAEDDQGGDGLSILYVVHAQQHGASRGGLGALHCNVAACRLLVDGRLLVEGYPIPRAALGTGLHTPRLCEGSEGSATNTAEPLALTGMCFLRMWAAACCRSTFCDIVRLVDTDHTPDAANPSGQLLCFSPQNIPAPPRQ
jgi:hypothetical protein